MPYPPPADVTDTSLPYSDIERAVQRIRESDYRLRAWSFLPDPKNSCATANSSSLPLDGYLFGVKDVIDVKGMPTRHGSRYTTETPTKRDATCVALLREAGAHPIGKTSTSEFAFRLPPETNNPAVAGRTPGGSSSGSAAAVAAGMIPFALSTQTGGSIIRPAAYCGTFGFKPSFGTISTEGLGPGCRSLDTIGWHARTIDISKKVAETLLGVNNGAWDKKYFDSVQSKQFNAKILLLSGSGKSSSEHDVLVNLNLAGRLLENNGASMRKEHDASVALIEHLSKAHELVMHYELGHSLESVVREHPVISAPVARLLKDYRQISALDYSNARREQDRYRERWDEIAGGADFILAPSAPSPPPKGLEDTGSSACCRVWSFLGWPCMHLPIGKTAEGLPIGFQIIMPWQHDIQTHQAADWIWRIFSEKKMVNSHLTRGTSI